MNNEKQSKRIMYLLVLIKWRWMIFFGTLLAAVLGVVVSIYVESYTATAVVAPRGAVGETDELEALIGSTGKKWANVRNVGEIVKYYSSAMKARPILEKMLQSDFPTSPTTHTYADQGMHNRAPLLDILKISGRNSEERIWQGVKLLKEKIKVSSGSGRIITVSFSASEPWLAADVVNEVIREFGERTKKVERSKVTVEIIETSLKNYRDELEESERALRQLKGKFMDLGDPSSETNTKIARLESTVTSLEREIETLTIEHARAKIRQLQKEQESELEFDILEQAVAPFEKDFSKKSVVLCFAAFGFLLNVLFAFTVDHLRYSLQTGDARIAWRHIAVVRKDILVMGLIGCVCLTLVVVYYLAKA